MGEDIHPVGVTRGGESALAEIEHDDIAAFADASVNLPSEDAKSGRERVQRLRDRLERYINDHPDFSLVKMLHAGSVAKGTALRTLNDMDVAVYVRRAEAPSDDELLDWLTERLREAYDGVLEPSQITPGHHCVTVSFKSEGGLDVDVVPVLYEDEPDDRGYLVAKDTGDKLLTSVSLHLDFVRTRKKANVDYAQIVRLIKWWIRQQQIQDEEFKFKSFMVELIVAKLSDDGEDLSSYPDAFKAVFAYILRTGLRERIAFSDYYKSSALPASSGTPIEIYDPVTAQNNVAFRYTETQRGKIVAAADVAFSAILEADYATTRGRAVDCWQLVLGPKFRG
jgi:tRNA nucleotidyltransferase (CCA-adding enzyme)